MVVWAAALPVIAKAAGAGIGAGASFFGSSAISSANSKKALRYQKDMMAEQNRYNNELMDKQFLYNRYFTENAHQIEVNDLYRAGLNPILSANGGSSGSVGLPSAGLLDAANSAAALDNAQNSRMQTAIEGMTALSNVKLNNSAAELNEQKVKTEQFDQAYKQIQNNIAKIDEKMKSEDWKYYPEKVKTELETQKKNLVVMQANIEYYRSAASAAMITATSAKELNDSNISLNKQTKILNKPKEDFNAKHPKQAEILEGVDRYAETVEKVLNSIKGTSKGKGQVKTKG